MNKLINRLNSWFYFASVADLALFAMNVLNIVSIGFLIWGTYLGGLDKLSTGILIYLAIVGMIDFMIQVNKGTMLRRLFDGLYVLIVLYSLFTK